MLATPDNAALERVLAEAVKVYEVAHMLTATTHFQLEAALTAVRDGRADDALRYIAAALELQERY